MSQPIALGAVLGGRYKVVASLSTSEDGDHVLQGEDQILRRRVSILVPSPSHESLLVDNARALAGGAGHSGFQVLDMGQTDESTYLVTSYTPADDLLDSLLTRREDSHDDSLSDDIFGGARGTASSSYIYEELDPTEPQQTVAAPEPGTPGQPPAVTRWSESDDDDYDDAPAAPSVRNRLGMRRKVRPSSVRSTMFDRAASQGTAAGASAAAANRIDPTYDGDNRYESYERTEGKPGRLDERSSSSRASERDDAERSAAAGAEIQGPDTQDTEAPDTDARGTDARDTAVRGTGAQDAGTQDTVAAHSGSAAHGEAGDTAATAAGTHLPAEQDRAARAAGSSSGRDAIRETDAALGRDRTSPGAASEPAATPGAAAAEGGNGEGAPAADGAPVAEENRRKGPLRWLLMLLLLLVLVAIIVLGFRSLGALTAQFSHQGPAQENAEPGQPQGPAASSQAATVAPEVSSVTRVTSDPNFMSDTDATLNQATDANPSTYWLSYGFSNAQFGNLVQYVGLAAELKEPATVQELTVQQANGSGGQFTVYVSDSPSLDGAEQVGTGSFTGPEIRVPLSDAARSTPHRYVLVVWNELPQLTSPIGGYPYGLRIGELSLR